MSYNGWKNYETWCVNLWLENDQELYEICRKYSEEADNSERDIADAMKDLVEDLAPTIDGLYADLLGAAMAEVDWREIAQSWRENYPPEVEE